MNGDWIRMRARVPTALRRVFRNHGDPRCMGRIHRRLGDDDAVEQLDAIALVEHAAPDEIEVGVQPSSRCHLSSAAPY